MKFYGKTTAESGDFVRGRVYGSIVQRMGVKEGTRIFARLEINHRPIKHDGTGWTLRHVEDFVSGKGLGDHYNIDSYDEFVVEAVHGQEDPQGVWI